MGLNREEGNVSGYSLSPERIATEKIGFLQECNIKGEREVGRSEEWYENELEERIESIYLS